MVLVVVAEARTSSTGRFLGMALGRMGYVYLHDELGIYGHFAEVMVRERVRYRGGGCQASTMDGGCEVSSPLPTLSQPTEIEPWQLPRFPQSGNCCHWRTS